MRSALFLSAALLAAPAFGQSTPEAFLALLPPVPGNVSTAKPADRAAFEGKVNRALTTMDQQIRLKKQREDKEGKASGEALEAKITGGRKGPSKAEQAKLEKMSDQEKMAWAMSQMAAMDPNAMREMAERGQATQKAVNVPKDARDRMARIGQVKGKYEALEAEVAALSGGGGRGFSSQARVVAPNLSAKFAASYIAILNEHLGAIKAALPDYKRQAQAMAAATGLPKATAESTDALTELRDYAARLMDVYKYNTSAK